MRAIALLSVLVALAGTASFAADPYPFQRSDGKWGYVDDDHCWVIEPQFEYSSEFSDGLAAVSLGERFGYINMTGKIVIKPQFQNTRSFSEGLAAVQIGGKWGFVDQSGGIAIDPKFDAADSFDHGLAGVSSNGLVGYIDKSGKVVDANIRPTELSSNGGIIPIEIGPENWVFGDKNGPAFPQRFENAGFFSEGLAAVKIGGLWGYIDLKGQLAIAPKFQGALSFNDGRATVFIGDKEFTIDRSGNILLEPTCDHTQ